MEASAGGATVNGVAPEVPGQCQHALLPTGSAAITVGLTSCYCNGRLGTVLAWHPDRGRYKVPLQDGRVLLLPMEHLVQSAVATTIPPLRVHQAAASVATMAPFRHRPCAVAHSTWEPPGLWELFEEVDVSPCGALAPTVSEVGQHPGVLGQGP